MNIRLTISLIFLVSFYSYSQQYTVSGHVKDTNNLPIAFCNVTLFELDNKSNIKGTTTGDEGFFEIPVKEKDTLLISHIKYKNVVIRISKEMITSKFITINLIEKTTELNEITIGKQKSIIERYNSIKSYEGPKVTAKSLGLPFANAKPKKDETIVSFQSGGVVSLDNLINALNGNNRRKKQLLKLQKQDRDLERIRKYFTDSFFVAKISSNSQISNNNVLMFSLVIKFPLVKH